MTVAYLYYPGCSTGRQRPRLRRVARAPSAGPLGIDLHEIDDWNCCGATEYLSLNLTPAYSLIARNLALAEQQANGTRPLLAACSACYLNLSKADHYMHEDKGFARSQRQPSPRAACITTPAQWWSATCWTSCSTRSGWTRSKRKSSSR